MRFNVVRNCWPWFNGGKFRDNLKGRGFQINL